MYDYTDISSESITRLDQDIEPIRNSLRNILCTRKGTFPGKPLFGASLHEYIFELNDVVTETLIRNDIENALRVWEKRVHLEDVVLERYPEYNKIIITVEFSLVDDFNDTTYTVDISI